MMSGDMSRTQLRRCQRRHTLHCLKKALQKRKVCIVEEEEVRSCEFLSACSAVSVNAADDEDDHALCDYGGIDFVQATTSVKYVVVTVPQQTSSMMASNVGKNCTFCGIWEPCVGYLGPVASAEAHTSSADLAGAFTACELEDWSTSIAQAKSLADDAIAALLRNEPCSTKELCQVSREDVTGLEFSGGQFGVELSSGTSLQLSPVGPLVQTQVLPQAGPLLQNQVAQAAAESLLEEPLLSRFEGPDIADGGTGALSLFPEGDVDDDSDSNDESSVEDPFDVLKYPELATVLKLVRFPEPIMVKINELERVGVLDAPLVESQPVEYLQTSQTLEVIGSMECDGVRYLRVPCKGWIPEFGNGSPQHPNKELRLVSILG